jgi:hypothetical protein
LLILNTLDDTVKNIQPSVNITDGLDVVSLPKSVDEIGAGQAHVETFTIKARKPGQYTFTPIKVSYTSNEGRNFVKSANEITLAVEGDELKKIETTTEEDSSLSKEPSLELGFEKKIKCRAGEIQAVSATLKNTGDIELNSIRFMGNSNQQVEVVEVPAEVSQLKPQQEIQLTLKVKSKEKIRTRIRPVEIIYKDPRGKMFFKASNELDIDSTDEIEG